MKNECPYCGGEDIVAVWIRDAKYGEIRLKDTPVALCHRCKTIGPYAANETAAIDAFCHPAHLHTYDPQTQIVVGRGDAETWLGWTNEGADKCDEVAAIAQSRHLENIADGLRAALEGKP